MRINYSYSQIKEYFPNIVMSLGSIIPTFQTERLCREFSSKIGWGSADIIRIYDNFGYVYIAGNKSFQLDQDLCGNDIQQIDIPLGEYDEAGNMKVVVIKKIIN